jgi:hypothetical protein
MVPILVFSSWHGASQALHLLFCDSFSSVHTWQIQVAAVGAKECSSWTLFSPFLNVIEAPDVRMLPREVLPSASQSTGGNPVNISNFDSANRTAESSRKSHSFCVGSKVPVIVFPCGPLRRRRSIFGSDGLFQRPFLSFPFNLQPVGCLFDLCTVPLRKHYAHVWPKALISYVALGSCGSS